MSKQSYQQFRNEADSLPCKSVLSATEQVGGGLQVVSTASSNDADVLEFKKAQATRRKQVKEEAAAKPLTSNPFASLKNIA